MAQIEEIQTKVNDILSGHTKGQHQDTQRSQRHFSSYVNEDVEKATALASRLMQIAEKKGGEAGLADAIEETERILGTEIPGLVQYALKLFITHYPEARAKLKLRPLEQRQPNLVRPSNPPEDQQSNQEESK
ncbi:MAG: hypothetical protein RMY29_017085 [Nostoc sp. CreGUA01]|nr:hypothetical protein [Nostoc sp. CreGUA01]